MTKKDLEQMIQSLWESIGPELMEECFGDREEVRGAFKMAVVEHLSLEIGPMFWSTPVYHDAMDIIESLGR
jgi:hypothetical protein